LAVGFTVMGMADRRIHLALSIAFTPACAVVKVDGGTTTFAKELEDQLAELAARRPMRVVLDLSGIGALSSVGLGVILSIRRAVATYGGQVQLQSAPAGVLELLRRTGVDVLFGSGPSPSAMPA
jgi:anti-anti-sigma factor